METLNLGGFNGRGGERRDMNDLSLRGFRIKPQKPISSQEVYTS